MSHENQNQEDNIIQENLENLPKAPINRDNFEDEIDYYVNLEQMNEDQDIDEIDYLESLLLENQEKTKKNISEDLGITKKLKFEDSNSL